MKKQAHWKIAEGQEIYGRSDGHSLHLNGHYDVKYMDDVLCMTCHHIIF